MRAPRWFRSADYRLLLAICALAASCQSPTWEVNYYVSPDGNDDWSGRYEEPNSAGDNGPFKTLGRALESVRALDKSDDRQIVVHIEAGVYQIDRALQLTAADGGFESAPVVWENAGNDEVILSGSRPVSNFVPVRNPETLARLEPENRDHIVMADLGETGVSNFGDFSDSNGPGLEVFFNGERMPLARYPNEGYVEIAEVPQSGDSLIHEGSWQWTRHGIPVGRHFGVIRFDDNRLAKWAPSKDIWMHGYFVWDWRDGFQSITRIDGERGLVYPAPPYHSYGFHHGQPVYFFNVLEELDRPGEWAIDTDAGILYFWPPSDLASSTVTVSVLEEPMFVLNGASNIRIEGLIFEETRATPIEVHDGENVVIAGNEIRNVGRNGIEVEGGTDHRILSNDLHDLGAGGIRIHGGDRVRLVAGNHEVVNNHIYRFSQIRKTSVPGIRVTGVGNRIAHNLLHDSPDAGIFFFGNDLLLEYNEIHHIAQESDDVGAFYIGRDYSMRGNVVRFNYIHDIAKPMNVGVMAVYLDDFTSGVTVHGNVFENAGRCVFMGGGRRNIVTNNLFTDCTPAVFLDARGKVRNTEFFDGRITVLKDRLDAVNATSPPYSERYPELVDLYNDDPAMPKYNVIQRNVAVGGTFLGLYSDLAPSLLDMNDNTIATDVVLQSSEETGVETEDFQTATMADTEVVDVFEAMGNRVLEPSESVDDIPKPEGFEAIPIDSIGLIDDQYRDTRNGVLQRER